VLTIRPDTGFSDINGNPITFTLQNGSISVTGVPESSSFALIALGVFPSFSPERAPRALIVLDPARVVSFNAGASGSLHRFERVAE
jgi:hypothetical protein